MTRKTIATVWLDGCSGCHMSFLDIDHRLLDLADMIELVYSPLVDRKDFPESVDITLIEGSVSNQADLDKIRHIRAHTRTLISLGDCAVTGNVPALRNTIGAEPVLQRAYMEPDLLNAQIPTVGVPPLLPVVRAVHTVVRVDVFIPGCPPSADTIFNALSDLLNDRQPSVAGKTRFGA
ncbi:MAG: NADP oxidoreductase [Anaerolineae bacterium]|nr:NADP oxidoreductase [Anaerolineae bacterium]NUQ03512.1 NADP oxidoreductase [Anaerolineae bacterium]